MQKLSQVEFQHPLLFWAKPKIVSVTIALAFLYDHLQATKYVVSPEVDTRWWKIVPITVSNKTAHTAQQMHIGVIKVPVIPSTGPQGINKSGNGPIAPVPEADPECRRLRSNFPDRPELPELSNTVRPRKREHAANNRGENGNAARPTFG